MAYIPNNYDPNGPRERGRVSSIPVFGRKITPPSDETTFETICPHECRMIAFGGCADACCLSARPGNQEPVWPTPKSL